MVDHALRAVDGLFPNYTRERAIRQTVSFVDERLNGEDGLGAIYPAMANSVMMYDALGYAEDHPNRAIARRSRSCSSCTTMKRIASRACRRCGTRRSPRMLLETRDARAEDAAIRGLEWLRPLQILDVRGDWISRRPHVRPGGWAFQYANAHYPDVDDTAVVAVAMERAQQLKQNDAYRDSIARAREWVVGMQSSDGGWGAFEPENTQYYLNNIRSGSRRAARSADGRRVGPLPVDAVAARRDAAEQRAGTSRTRLHAQGTGTGRQLVWPLGMNYVYGTWTALCSLNAAGLTPDDPRMKRGAQWLLSIQNKDGGWGEDGDSYKLNYRGFEQAPSTASQTAWALLGLMAAGEVNNPAVARGIDSPDRRAERRGLVGRDALHGDGLPARVLPALPRLSQVLPARALARYRNLKRDNTTRVTVGL